MSLSSVGHLVGPSQIKDPTTTNVDAFWNDNHGGLFNGMTSCSSDLDWAETFLPGGLLTCEDWIDPSQIVVEWDDFPEGSSLGVAQRVHQWLRRPSFCRDV